MDRVGAGDLGRRDQSRNLEIGIARWRRADAHVVIGEAYMERLAVSLRVHGHGLDTELAAGTDDAERDLSPIRDQNFLEHAAEPSAWW